MIDWTQILVALIGGALTLAGVVVTNRRGNREMAEQVKKLEEHQRKNYLGILRLTIMSEEMPVSERIIAGKEYLDHGGNGDVSKYYKEELLANHTK